jgi:hypothetical protein
MNDPQHTLRVLTNLSNRYFKRKFKCICKINSLRFLSYRNRINSFNKNGSTEIIYLISLEPTSEKELEIKKELIIRFMNNLLDVIDSENYIKISRVKWVIVPPRPANG